jgi:two-component system, OmpR family, KDP operon response regulator KdpE
MMPSETLARQTSSLRARPLAQVLGRRVVGRGSRILICDSESQSLHALRVVLRRAGFEVDATERAAEALDRSAIRLPAAAIVECLLPDGDGVEVCRRLREWNSMPVLMLSAVSDEEQQVRAFDAGADDYLTKPFGPEELVARLRARLRRAEGLEEEPTVRIGGLEVDLAAHAVRRDGYVIHLTPTEFKLLSVLVRNRGRMMTHDTLLKQVWGPAYIDAKQTLRGHIANLRRKIEPEYGACLIGTEPRLGYRFADTDHEDPGQRPSAIELSGCQIPQPRVVVSTTQGAAVWVRQDSRYSSDTSPPVRRDPSASRNASVTVTMAANPNHPSKTQGGS